MKSQITLSKAFELNKNPLIYGAFAEIGAGQETVNFFYKAGMASQTVAKSMSAYDMTVSDEIYGKQNRYVCKDRLITMLNHEYRLLEKRLKRKLGKTTRFFVFATTAVTSTRKKGHAFSSSQHAWMGLRFQAKPLEAFNDIIFHVNCLDKNRLQQHEALGILGVNLIYSAFHSSSQPKKLISSLNDNLSGSRIDIHGMSCSGPFFKKVSSANLNLELLSQKLSSMVFFSPKGNCEFLSDATFGQNLVILYGGRGLIKLFLKKGAQHSLSSLSLEEKKSACIFFIPSENLNKKTALKEAFKGLDKKNLSVLTAPELSLEELKNRLRSYSSKPLLFLISEEYFKDKMFDSQYYSKGTLLKSLGSLFDSNTKTAVLSKNKDFSVKTHRLKDTQEQILKDYLVSKKTDCKLFLKFQSKL